MTVVQSENLREINFILCFLVHHKKHKVPPVVIYAVPMYTSEIQSCLHYIFFVFAQDEV